MANKTMKTLTIGDNTYEIHDATARSSATAAQNTANGKANATHASQHASGGSDPITPAAIGAATTQHTHAVADVTGLSNWQTNTDGKILLLTNGINEIKTSAQTNALYGHETKKVQPLLRKLNHVAVGAYDEDENNYVGDFYKYKNLYYSDEYAKNNNEPNTNDPSDVYWYLMNKISSQGYGNKSNQPTTEYLKGRYSYNFTRTKAYKLDHVTRTASLVADCSSILNSGTWGTYDRIIAVDDTYIYIAQHIARRSDYDYGDYYGTITKYDHNLNMIATASETSDNARAWMFDGDEGWSGSDNGYYSCFDNLGSHFSYLAHMLYTKDYIVYIARSNARSTSDKYIYYMTVVSKISLKVVNRQLQIGSSTPRMYASVIYDDNLVLIFEQDHYFRMFKLTETEIINRIPYASNHSVLKINGEWCYLIEFDRIVNHAGKTYFKLKLEDTDDHEYYTVVTLDDLHDFDTIDYTVNNDKYPTIYLENYITVQYATTTNFPFDVKYYDPINDNFDYYGETFELYPAYVAPSNLDNPVICDRFEMTPYFKTDNYYYFNRLSDNKVYKLDSTKDIYEIERLVEVE